MPVRWNQAGTARLKLQCDELLSNFVTNLKLRRYRSAGWVAWKRDGCKDFERAAAAAPEPPAPPVVVRRRPRAGAAVPAVPPAKRVKLGNPELDRLW